MICCSIARPGLHTSRALCGRRKARKSCATGASRYLAAHPRRSKATRGEAGSSTAIGPRCEVPHGLPTALEADVCTRHVGPHTYTRGADGDTEISTATHFGRARGSWTMWQMDSSGALLLLDASHVTTGLTLAEPEALRPSNRACVPTPRSATPSLTLAEPEAPRPSRRAHVGSSLPRVSHHGCLVLSQKKLPPIDPAKTMSRAIP